MEKEKDRVEREISFLYEVREKWYYLLFIFKIAGDYSYSKVEKLIMKA